MVKRPRRLRTQARGVANPRKQVGMGQGTGICQRPGCGRSLPPGSRSDRKWCSGACQSWAHRRSSGQVEKNERLCSSCLKPLIGQYANAKVCRERRCRAWAAKHPGVPHPSTQSRTCAWCGKSIDHLNAKGKFCDITCNSSYWHAVNPDKARAKVRKRYQSNEGKAVKQRYAREHAAERQRWAREDRRSNPDRYRSYWQQWYEGNREAATLAAKTRRGRRNGNSVGIEFLLRDWQRLVRRYNGCCAYCGVKAEPVYMDHVVPLAKGGRHSIGNVLPACFYCNSTKHSMLLSVWRHRNSGGRGAPDGWQMVEPNRARGERHGKTRTTEDEVRQIRRLYSAGTKQVVLAEMFSITQAAVSNIVRRKTWTHID